MLPFDVEPTTLRRDLPTGLIPRCRERFERSLRAALRGRFEVAGQQMMLPLWLFGDYRLLDVSDCVQVALRSRAGKLFEWFTVGHDSLPEPLSDTNGPGGSQVPLRIRMASSTAFARCSEIQPYRSLLLRPAGS